MPAFAQQQIDDIRLIQERYAWFLDGVFADAVFEKKKKGQRENSSGTADPVRADMKILSAASVSVKTLRQTRRRVNAVPHPRREGKAEIVEKMYLDRLLDFVYVEFMKGLQRDFCAEALRQLWALV